MLDKLSAALETYQHQWDALVAARANADFFTGLKPVAVGWKTTDRAQYSAIVASLHDSADQIIETWMNGRWIAKLHLKQPLANSISIVKIMERRPESTDAVGLDHVDFYAATDLDWNKEVLTAEPDLKWTVENNDIIEGYEWLSVWFDATEAKIKHDTVLDIVGAELSNLNHKIIGE